MVPVSRSVVCGAEDEAARCKDCGYDQLMLRPSFERGPRKSALSVGVVDVFIGPHWFSHLVIHSFQIVILFHLTRFYSIVRSLSSYSNSLSCSLGTNRSLPPQFLRSSIPSFSLIHPFIGACSDLSYDYNLEQSLTARNAPTWYLRNYALLV